MKRLFCLLTISVLINLSVVAQEKTFLRFYDFSGHKFEMGRIEMTTDSSIFVSRDTLMIEISVSNIYSIKTKRSFGHQALVSSFITGIPITFYAVSTGESKVNDGTAGGILHDGTTFTPGEAAIMGVFGGMVSGIIIGGIVSGRTQTFVINGDKEIWKKSRNNIALKGKP